MAEYKKLQKMIQSALRQSAEETSLLLNQELSVDEDTAVLESNKQQYLDALEDSGFFVAVESREDYPGRFYMVFALRDAILMSGILLGIPPARISEKRKLLILEADDIDAFSEIANQIIGSFNSVFQPCLPNKVHLKQLPPTKFVPQIDKITEETPIPAGEYLVYKAQITLKGEEMNRFDMLVPFPLANLFDPQESAVTADGSCDAPAPDQAESLRKLFPEDSAGCVDSADGFKPVTSVTDRKILVLEDDAKEREKIKELLSANGYTTIMSNLSGDVSKLLTGEGISAVVLGATKAEEWELTLCSKIRELSDDPKFPIIMSALQWTRTGVLKAVVNGAKEVIIKPYDEGELVTKLSKFFHAA
jgi:CheY-like chemotaxis protein